MNEEVNNYEKKNNGVKVLLIILIVLVLCLIGLTVYKTLIYNKKDNKPNKENTGNINKVDDENRDLAEKLVQPFDNLYFDKSLNTNIIYSDSYNFNSISNELKIDLAYYSIDMEEKHEITKKDIEDELKKLFGSSIDLSSLVYTEEIGSEGCAYKWNDSKQIYEEPSSCGVQTPYSIYSKIEDIKIDGNKLEIYKKYILSYASEIDENGETTKLIYYSDSNMMNVIKEFDFTKEEEDIDLITENVKLLDKGDSYKITFTKDGNNYYFESMNKN